MDKQGLNNSSPKLNSLEKRRNSPLGKSQRKENQAFAFLQIYIRAASSIAMIAYQGSRGGVVKAENGRHLKEQAR